jgi:hypothetical protein
MVTTGGRSAKLKARTVWKTEVWKHIEGLSRDRTALENAVNALKGSASLIEIGVRNGSIGDDSDRARHIEEHWLGDDRSQRVLREGLIKAGERALELGVPVDAYWVFAGERLEVAVASNERQVTLLVVTPFPGDAGGFASEEEAPPQDGIEIIR